MPSADQVPVNSSHSTMHWPLWVVLIAGSTGSALRAVRPPNLHITPDARCDLVYAARAAETFLAFTPGHHRPRHPGDLVGERDGCDLRGSPRQQRGEPRPMLGAMDLGIADHGECASSQQAAQIAIAAFAYQLPSRSLPPLEFCLGTNRSRPRSPFLTETSSDLQRWQPERSPTPERARP